MRTERDTAPEPRESRLRFMIAGQHLILDIVIFSIFREAQE